MAEEDANPGNQSNQNTDSSNAGDNTGQFGVGNNSGNKGKQQDPKGDKTGDVKKKKKRRRRRRPKKKKPVQDVAPTVEAKSTEEVTIKPEDQFSKETEPVKKSKKRRRRRPRKKKPSKKEEVPVEEILEEEIPSEEPVEAPIEDLAEEEVSLEDETPIDDKVPLDDISLEEDVLEEKEVLEELLDEPLEEPLDESVDEPVEAPVEDLTEETGDEGAGDEELSEEELLGEEILTEKEISPENEFTDADLPPDADLIEPPVKEEEKFLSAGDKGKGEEAFPPEGTPPPEEGPSDFAVKEEQEGPVGWDQLKNAIKKDHDESENMLQGQPAVEHPEVIAEPVTVEQPGSEPEVQNPPEDAAVAPSEVVKEVEPVAVPTPTKSVEEGPSEQDLEKQLEGLPTEHDDDEKQEVFNIIKKYAIGGCVAIAILVGILVFQIPQKIYGGIAGFISGSGQTETVSQPTETETATETGEKVEEGVGTALITGGQIPKVKRVPSSIQTIFDIGVPQLIISQSDRITTYMEVLSRLQNSFATDVHQLLDNSTDRGSTLEFHIKELVGIYNEAQQVQQQLNEEKDAKKVEFNAVSSEKNRLEKEFFSAVEKLKSETANDILAEFIDYSKLQIEYKAEFNALNKLSGLYKIALNNMDLRIKDLQANRAALIKGVKVIDIKGSDLDLIILESELSE